MVYIIKKITFDNLENHVAMALDEEYLGYVNVVSEEDVKKTLESLDNETKKYEGWNGEKYPKFKAIEVSEYEGIFANVMSNDEKYELVCKVLKQGYVWSTYQDDNENTNMYKSLIDRFEYNLYSKKYLLTHDKMQCGDGFELKDYGKIWFLKKNKSE